MSTISATMTHDHRRCDEIFAAAENETAKGNWEVAATQFEAFHSAMEHHFKQVSLRPRERFWDIPVPKIDSAFDSLFVPRPSRSLALR
ncbi:MAG: hypothetical protein JMN24_13505, partial [gamma proteobacterium endosymbiont of Lamellibrachia anaximandri]|nr:hypothetical protein [gamma proteobacterium endosymbiont of Lamellibrachia anaximandri]